MRAKAISISWFIFIILLIIGSGQQTATDWYNNGSAMVIGACNNQGDRRCAEVIYDGVHYNGYQICGDYYNNGSLLWSGLVACQSGQVCQPNTCDCVPKPERLRTAQDWLMVVTENSTSNATITENLQETYLNSTINCSLCNETTNSTSQEVIISGTVFEDLNGNGVKDSDEIGLPEWIVTLGKPAPSWASLTYATTDVDGKYAFTNINEDNYMLYLNPKEGWIDPFEGGIALPISAYSSGKPIDLPVTKA